jgi:hypothetical protein
MWVPIIRIGRTIWVEQSSIILDFKITKAFTSPFTDKYARPYKMFHKLHPNVYILLLPTTFVAHSTFHVSKLKLFHENKKNKNKKHAYHLRFDIIEHRLVGEVECI